MRRLPRIGISLGCPCGIGAEITLKALRLPSLADKLTPVLFGDASIKHPNLRAVSALRAGDRKAGKPTKASGHAQYAYLTAAIAAAKAGEIDGLCTAPVSKEAIVRSGIPFVGHTEVLAEAFACQVMMLMKGPKLSVALATNHLPLSKVPSAITQPLLLRQLTLLSKSLTTMLGRSPTIAVCGLNPHAGDGGVFGDEEARILRPAIVAAQRKGIDCDGPFPADGLFAQASKGFRFDVALAMFHDQGLIAVKTFDFDRTVNVTLGLPVIRTSPDHGVAYDIAGKNRANPAPMAAALLEAAALA
jgi:4-hydroxythreonine-4-phosphate dehydrogenase